MFGIELMRLLGGMTMELETYQNAEWKYPCVG